MLSAHGISENLKDEEAALQKEDRRQGTGFKTTSVRLLDAVLDELPRKERSEQLVTLEFLQYLRMETAGQLIRHEHAGRGCRSRCPGERFSCFNRV